MHVSDEDLHAAEQLRWGISRLASRLRAEQPGSGRPLPRLSASLLSHLKHSGPLTVSELASIEGVQAQSLTRVLNDLEQQGRVTRTRSAADRRRQDIALTAAGEQALREHVRDGNAWLAEALARHLSPAERGLLRLAGQLMQQLAAAETGLQGREGADAGAAPRGTAGPL
ncbi:MarR family transcriptional regulator [Streptomyces sp. ISL-22]|uniref:MarR family winged helix-turn-helix transcriptional regulator n=1 Tax=unclassified Streptomyces TaxID=2593676 RepID=UPI001BE53666|nr:MULTISPECIES: MarR family transcriptional regulator [unclassified Streptomyces]MBT2423708.1 MarR family transcriptional regulator [Streptomyces sp. ISL-24]MBT2438352.1 MarR family transcriptional regulator [Streptomyces sp. ISL-22]